jgi:hypothetical protein
VFVRGALLLVPNHPPPILFWATELKKHATGPRPQSQVSHSLGHYVSRDFRSEGIRPCLLPTAQTWTLVSHRSRVHSQQKDDANKLKQSYAISCSGLEPLKDSEISSIWGPKYPYFHRPGKNRPENRATPNFSLPQPHRASGGRASSAIVRVFSAPEVTCLRPCLTDN